MTIAGVRYDPRHQWQLTPTDPHGGVNCSAYAAAMAFDGATVGGLVVTGRDVRSLSSEATPDPASPGLRIPQLVAVATRLHIVLNDKSDDALGTFDQAMNDIGKRGEYVILQGDADQLPGTTFNGPHAILVVEIVGTGAWCHNPLSKAGQTYPITALRRYAEKFARDTGMPKSPHGDQRVRYATTRHVPRIFA